MHRNAVLQTFIRRGTLISTKERGDSSPSKPKPGLLGAPDASPLRLLAFVLLCSEFFGLALMTHEFKRSLGLFVSLRDLLLHLASGLFHFW